MDLAAGERLITSETDAVERPRCSAKTFSVLRLGAVLPERELIAWPLTAQFPQMVKHLGITQCFQQ
jgi:hypothetical protein